MLATRGDLAEQVEIRGDQSLFDVLDELDERFDGLTMETSDVPWVPGAGWWWKRLPSDPVSRAYALGR